MTKEVELIIKGSQKYDTYEDNDLETRTVAEYYYRNHCHYVLYEELAEGFNQTTKSMLKLREGCLEMTRKGVVNTTMVFEKGKETMTHYKTPFGEVLLGIQTKTLEMSEAEDLICADITYALNADGMPMADCGIKIQICSAGK